MNNTNIQNTHINLLDRTDNSNPSGKKVFRASKFLIYLLTILGLTFLIFSYQVLFTNTSFMESLGGKNTLFKQLSILARGGNELNGAKDDRINILLLGIGGAGHDGPNLTDTIMVASIQPSTNKLAIFSIPRDTLVPIADGRKDKINTLNHLGEMANPGSGGEYASQTISQIFDIPIHYYLRVDFTGFEKLVDDLGGIKINVERGFIDYQYPDDNLAYQVVYYDPGWQTMDGDTALKFVRSRHGNNGEGSDFARSKRQQQVMMAIKDRALSYRTLFSPRQLSKLMEAFGGHVKTNMEIADIVNFYKLSKDIKVNEAQNTTFDDRPNGYLVASNYNGAYVLEPATGNFSNMQMTIKTIFETKAEIKEPEAYPLNVEVRNGTETNGLALKLSDKLKANNVKVLKIGNAPSTDYTETIIYQLNESADKNAWQNLQTIIPGRVEVVVPDWVKTDAELTTDYYIVLGKDASISSP
jgi:LCP family protein required for cell wall assembly